MADVRIVAATHHDLAAAVADGSFREDLFYRLKGVVLRTPSLDDRMNNVPLLARMFLRRMSEGRGSFAPDALDWLAARHWPGNVRELRAAVECAAALAVPAAAGVVVGAADLAFAVGDVPAAPIHTVFGTLDEEVTALEHRRIVEALARTGYNHTHRPRTRAVAGRPAQEDRPDGATLTAARSGSRPRWFPDSPLWGSPSTNFPAGLRE